MAYQNWPDWKSRMLRAYIRRGVSDNDICKALGCSKAVIRRYRKIYNIEVKKPCKTAL